MNPYVAKPNTTAPPISWNIVSSSRNRLSNGNRRTAPAGPAGRTGAFSLQHAVAKMIGQAPGKRAGRNDRCRRSRFCCRLQDRFENAGAHFVRPLPFGVRPPSWPVALHMRRGQCWRKHLYTVGNNIPPGSRSGSLRRHEDGCARSIFGRISICDEIAVHPDMPVVQEGLEPAAARLPTSLDVFAARRARAMSRRQTGG